LIIHLYNLSQHANVVSQSFYGHLARLIDARGHVSWVYLRHLPLIVTCSFHWQRPFSSYMACLLVYSVFTF